MESKEHQLDNSNNQAPNINIDISGDGQEENGVKNMNFDSSTESRAGLSKDELMKYASQPFWVRLRNILFASFWIVWFSILVAAIGYVVNSPNCVKLASATSTAAVNQTMMNSSGSSASSS